MAMRLGLLAFFAVVLCQCCVSELVNRPINTMYHTRWTVREGVPKDITAIQQTRDGYLWLGSIDGLYRFDGVVFEGYQPQSGGPLPARSVSSLLALRNGDLWIGFRSGGISLLRNGHATNYTTRDRVPGGRVCSIAQDREGTIWVATSSGLARLEGSRLRATWLRDCAELLGLATFMAAAGISCSQRLGYITAGLDPADEAHAVTLLGAARQP